MAQYNIKLYKISSQLTAIEWLLYVLKSYQSRRVLTANTGIGLEKKLLPDCPVAKRVQLWQLINSLMVLKFLVYFLLLSTKRCSCNIVITINIDSQHILTSTSHSMKGKNETDILKLHGHEVLQNYLPLDIQPHFLQSIFYNNSCSAFY